MLLKLKKNYIKLYANSDFVNINYGGWGGWGRGDMQNCLTAVILR